MREPLVERRELAPRLEVQVRVVSDEPGGPMRLTRYFGLPSAGWASWLPTRRGSKPGRRGKALLEFSTIRIKRRAHEP
jgi:hypothetical protein